MVTHRFNEAMNVQSERLKGLIIKSMLDDLSGKHIHKAWKHAQAVLAEMMELRSRVVMADIAGIDVHIRRVRESSSRLKKMLL